MRGSVGQCSRHTRITHPVGPSKLADRSSITSALLIDSALTMNPTPIGPMQFCCRESVLSDVFSRRTSASAS
jgi:hypothetical protein